MNLKKWIQFLLIAFIVHLQFHPDFATAQTATLFTGDQIKLTAPNYFFNSIKGTLIEVNNDSLSFLMNKRSITLPLSQITKLEVARGKKRNTKKGLIIGALIGGAAMAIAIALTPENPNSFGPSKESVIFPLSTLSAVVGAGIGAIIGSGIESTRWVKVPLEGLSMGKRKATPVFKAEGPEKPIQPAVVPTRRWRFSFTVGTTSSGPAGDIEKSMMPGGWLGGPAEHPVSHTGFGEIGVPWSLQVTNGIKQRFEGAILIGHAPIGYTSGCPGIFLYLNYYSTIVSPMLMYKPFSILHLALGPAVFINKIEQESGGEIIYREQRSRLGVLLQASLLYPKKTRFFVQCDVQYRYLGKATFGPFRDTYRGTPLAQLSPFEANFSHMFVGFGIGVHL